ncbi:hypothetical protein FUA23_00370 [Neolewinella aurantiaca]|uniref:Phytanoyl-CoA dioxygenase n=1 Tax=Neolewinella aurantiaca TaxID=2602767 RepID=A0A5C7G1D1_9BACT|nr:hypothetical protein [Neolewinella aurantiaca]TXF91672.1 hypothetical protein FUA23_00370 [Neolewinella aurantiaca]
MNELHLITDTILETSSTPRELMTVLHEFKDLLFHLTEIKGVGEKYRNDISTEAGLAIGTEWAARCVDDVYRSVKFIRGVHQAINDRLAVAPGQPVQLLYAGTGPFATLVLPLLTRFSPAELQLTLVEINELSITALRRLFSYPEYHDYARAIIQSDCTTVELPDWETYDILLTETMQYALQREHQVPLTLHLISKLRKDVVLIPQEIRVGLAAVNPTIEREDWEITPYSCLLSLTAAGLSSPGASNGKPGTADAPHELLLPARPEVRGSLAFTTDIHVYGGEHLGFNQSGLTVPRIIYSDGGGEEDRTFRWHYGFTPEPGLVWQMEEA